MIIWYYFLEKWKSTYSIGKSTKLAIFGLVKNQVSAYSYMYDMVEQIESYKLPFLYDRDYPQLKLNLKIWYSKFIFVKSVFL